MSIGALFAEAEQARATWDELQGLLHRGKLDFDSGREAIDGQSVSAFSRRIALVFEALIGIIPADINSASGVLVSAKSTEIRSIIKVFYENALATLSTLKANWRDDMAFVDQNTNFRLQLITPDAGVLTNADISESFRQINLSVGQLLTQLSQLIPFCRAESVADLSTRATALGDLVRDADSLRRQAKQFAVAAEKSAISADQHDKALENSRSQAESALSKVQAIQQQATADVGAVAALVEKIKAIGSSADALEKQIAGYAGTFEAFQKQLDRRNQEFVQFQSDNEVAQKISAERGSEIDRLTKLADAMISGATTAGLAKSMEDTRKRYEARMNGARFGFYFAVFLLIASALPLAAHLLPGLVGSWIPGVDLESDGSPYSVLGKILLLLPATWFTAFFTRSYADFFHLEREYAHKAALAMSVDGFKRQAEKYQEEITAEVFLEIRNNPAKGSPVTPASHPLYDVLAKVVGKVLDKSQPEKTD